MTKDDLKNLGLKRGLKYGYKFLHTLLFLLPQRNVINDLLVTQPNVVNVHVILIIPVVTII